MRKILELQSKFSKIIMNIITLLFIAFITAAIYFSGGTNSELDHLMYLPIIFTGLFFPIPITLVITLIAGLVLGPWMPFMVNGNVSQEHVDWIVRLMSFIFVAVETGLLRVIFIRTLKENEQLYTHHLSTNIPNTKILQTFDFSDFGKKASVLSIVIEKYEQIVYYFGEDVYGMLLTDIYNALNDNLLNHKIIVSNNTNFIGIILDNDEPSLASVEIFKILRDLRKNLKYPIYFEFSLGTDLVNNIHRAEKTEAIFKKSTSKAISNIARKTFLTDPEATNDFDYPLLADIESALANDEFYLVYQPLKYKDDSNVLYFEALIRWNHPTKGFISPNEFIPIVENTFLINPLSIWVLRKTIEHIKHYNEQGYEMEISINISPRNLYSTTFVNSVQSVIDEYRFDTKFIKFEVTEGMAINISQRSLENLNRLDEMGIKIAIDDFGSGHASVSYLIQMPITYVKLDRLITTGIMDDDRELILFNNTVNLIKELGLKVVAEGIETKEHFEALKKADLDYYQGFYLSKPLEGSALDRWIKKTPKKFLNL